jgi:DNA-binding CsgD family transcriptional regulator
MQVVGKSGDPTLLEPQVEFILQQILGLVEESVLPTADPHVDDAVHDSVMGHEDSERVVMHLEVNGSVYALVKVSARPRYRPLLSLREQEILHLIAGGYPNKTIAHQLGISQWTVNTHVRRIFTKLGVRSRAEMVACAYEAGVL